MAYASRHVALLLLATLAFGLLVLPFLVYLTGTYAFGAYTGGGAMGLFGDFLRALASGRWYAWSLALGPLVIAAIALGLWRLASDRVATRG